MNPLPKLEYVYDLYAKSLLNRYYYEDLLTRAQRIHFWISVGIAVGSASGGIAGWELWNTPDGKYYWAIVAGTSSIAALIKPVLNIEKKIEIYSKILSAHTRHFYILENIKVRIATEGGISPDTDARISDVAQGYQEVAQLELEKVKEKIRDKYEERVRQRMKEETFWWPPKNESNSASSTA